MTINGLNHSYSNAYSSMSAARAPGAAQPGAREAPQGAANADEPSSSVVTLSAHAMAVSAEGTTEPSFAEVGLIARDKLDALKSQAAERTGTAVGSLNLHRVDYSSFSDQELAAMNLNPSANFSKVEQIHAQGMLGERVRVSLETFRNVTEQGDRRGHTMTIHALYSQMTPEVRSALNWTPVMMESNDRMMVGDQRHLGKFPISTVLANLAATQAEGGIEFDVARFLGQDSRAPTGLQASSAEVSFTVSGTPLSSTSLYSTYFPHPGAGDPSSGVRTDEPTFLNGGMAARAKPDAALDGTSDASIGNVDPATTSQR